jgi:tetratricopeptide (TPR) repeat protein
MKADCFILQVCEFLDDGDGMYRLHEPSRYLSWLPGVVVIDCHYHHRLLPSLLDQADILVLPFFHNWDFFPIIERRRAAGQVTVFEANDYFYDVQPWNPVARQWQDRAIQDEYRQYMAIADAVQTSTPELARRWQPWARRVFVFRNYLTDVPPLAAPPARPLTIGWGGSPGHLADWYHLTPWLQQWLEAHPDVRLAVMTNEFGRPFINLPSERYHFTPFGSLAAYYQFLHTLDIGLAPLLPSEYNRCRSDVKYLEYASRGVAGIYADLEPYRATVEPGKTGLLYRTPEEFLQALDRLAGDAALRQSIREQAHAYVHQQRRLADHIGERLDAYRNLLPAGPRGVELSADVLAAAVRDGNYLQLRPGEPETVLRAAAESAGTVENAQKLQWVLQGYPNYLAALQEQGRILNDLRDTGNALAHLERARVLNPSSARTLGEMGRAHFIAKNAGEARRLLEQALEQNPWNVPCWLYLYRLLLLTRSPDGPYWAERGRQLYPQNYTLALAGARLYPGGEGLTVLQRLLEEYGAMFTPEEKSAAALAFGQAILEMAGPHLAAPEAVPLLQQTCAVFPQSARLADLLAYALRLAGQHEASHREYARALELQRAATLFRAEFPQEDGRFHLWQFAEHIRDHPLPEGTDANRAERLATPEA